MLKTGLLGLPLPVPPGETRTLKQALSKEYEHFSDKRIRNIDRGKFFIIDGRGEGDYGADRQLFGWFCTAFAEVINANTVKISLGGSIPHGRSVDSWIQIVPHFR